MADSEIWIIDCDADDCELIAHIFQEDKVQYALRFFEKGPQVLDALQKTTKIPFLMVSCTNLPGMNGFQLREKLLTETRINSIPFIFWSTGVPEEQIEQAYSLGAHGFFIKPASYNAWKTLLHNIIAYWQMSKVPSKRIV